MGFMKSAIVPARGNNTSPLRKTLGKAIRRIENSAGLVISIRGKLNADGLAAFAGLSRSCWRGIDVAQMDRALDLERCGKS